MIEMSFKISIQALNRNQVGGYLNLSFRNQYQLSAKEISFYAILIRLYVIYIILICLNVNVYRLIIINDSYVIFNVKY